MIWRTRYSLKTQCLGSVVPLAMFRSPCSHSSLFKSGYTTYTGMVTARQAGKLGLRFQNQVTTWNKSKLHQYKRCVIFLTWSLGYHRWETALFAFFWNLTLRMFVWMLVIWFLYCRCKHLYLVQRIVLNCEKGNNLCNFVHLGAKILQISGVCLSLLCLGTLLFFLSVKLQVVVASVSNLFWRCGGGERWGRSGHFGSNLPSHYHYTAEN